MELSYYFCDVKPSEFWVLTPAETEMMILKAGEKRTQEMEFQSSLMANICAAVMQANGAKKKDKRQFEPSDFMPKSSKKSKNVPRTVEQLQEMARASVLKCGGTIINK